VGTGVMDDDLDVIVVVAASGIEVLEEIEEEDEVGVNVVVGHGVAWMMVDGFAGLLSVVDVVNDVVGDGGGDEGDVGSDEVEDVTGVSVT
jgi:hypothetical protein